MSNSLLAVALSAATNHSICTYEEHAKNPQSDVYYLNLQQDNLHLYNLVKGRVATTDKPLPTGAVIHVMTISGRKLTLQYDPSHTVDILKNKIEEELNICPNDQALVFRGKRILNGRLLSDYNIQNQSTICLSLRSIGGGGGPLVMVLQPDLLAPAYHYDFTNIRDSGVTFMRGPFEYKRPCGWNRIALNVSGKYGNDDAWLGSGGDGNVWPVSYHGTANYNCKSIAEDGFLLSKGKRFAFGYGVYTTPDIDVAALYATQFVHEGTQYKVVFQNRVNPGSLSRVSEDVTGVGEYWISPNEKDVRPYGVCIKKVD